jgi:iron complex outermembrane receptor protein
MFNERVLVRSLRVAFGSGLAGLTLAALPLYGQEVQRGDKVEVTGSSIKRIDAETALPVQIITRQDIDRIGAQNTEDLLKTISAANTVLGVQISNAVGAATSGVSTVSLRGLGSKRTLVLVNGRRITPFGGVAGGGGGASVDVNSIPIAAIERIEVLKDGASAVYGSDAVAGVINFILRTDYRGAEASIQYGQTTHSGDGRTSKADALVGFGDLNVDRFNVMINASYEKEDAIFGAQRNYARSSTNVTEGNDTTSGNTWPGTIVNAAGASRSFLAPAFAAQVANGTFPTFGLTDCAPSVVIPAFYGTNRCRYDPAQVLELTPKSERSGVNLSAHFAVNSDTQLYTELNGTRNLLKYQLQATPISDQFALNAADPYTPVLTALINSYGPVLQNTYGPSGVYDTLFGKTTFLLPTTSPYYPTAFAATQGLAGSPIDIRYRSIENGPRVFHDDNRAARALGGIKGTLGAWDYDLAALYTESRVKEILDGGFPLYTKLLPLLNSGVVNPFGPSTPAVQQQILATNFTGEAFHTKTSIGSINGRVSRDLYTLPAGPMAIAIGGDVRKEKYAFSASDSIAVGDVSGYGGNFIDVAKSRNVEALFTELNVPIVKGLEGDVAVRYDNYQGVGNTTNPKASIRWQPAKEVLLRASWGTGFRAPSLDELYAPVTTGVTQNGVSDPLRCPTTGSSTDCSTQFSIATGGNARLTPEKTTSKTIGFVLEPTADLHVAVDYFDIFLRNQVVIGGVSYLSFLDTAEHALQFANLITRAPSIGGLPGAILSINQQNLNLGNSHLSGIDLDFRWRLPTDSLGRFTVAFNGTYMTRYDGQNLDGSYTGLVANANVFTGSVLPRWKHNANVAWDFGPWAASVTQNFQGAYEDLPSNITGQTRRVGVYETFDMQGSYFGFKNTKLTLGMRNIFDKDPPYSNVGGAVYFQAGYDASYADIRGRLIYAKLGYSFR